MCFGTDLIAPIFFDTMDHGSPLVRVVLNLVVNKKQKNNRVYRDFLWRSPDFRIQKKMFQITKFFSILNSGVCITRDKYYFAGSIQKIFWC